MRNLRSPLQLIELYWGEVYNAGNTNLIRKLCADPIIRHDAMSVTLLSHDEQVARVIYNTAQSEPYFTHEVLLADETYVCSVWNMFSRKGEPTRMSGIEVFKAENGRFTDCWNSTYSLAYWGREAGDPDPLAPRRPRRHAAGTRPPSGRNPRELMELFRRDALRDGDIDLLRDVCADPIARYVPGGMAYISVEALATAARIHGDAAQPEFKNEVLLTNDHYVCSIWNMRTSKSGLDDRSGIEVFRVEDGRLVEHWAAPETRGVWGRIGDAAVPKDLPPPAQLTSVRHIDHTWMQSVFAHANVKMPRIAMVTVNAIGHGTMSTTVQAELGYNQEVEGVPLTVVCKFHSEIAETQPLVKRFAPYTTEVSAYRYFGDVPPMRTPRAYLAQVSDDGLLANLVLEDLAAFCEAGDQIEGCSPVEAAAVARELAKLHRHFWRRTDIGDLEWTVGKRRSAAETPALYAAGAAIFRERYSSVMLANEIDLIEAFSPHVLPWMRSRNGNETLIHGDPRVDNIMFDRRDPSNLVAYLIDWQGTDGGEAQYDLAYFLSGSLSPEDRRTCERQLIVAHAETIAEVDPTYTAERAMDAYRRNIVSGLYTTVVAANIVPDTPPALALLTTLARRNCAAVRDWRGIERLSAIE